MSIALVLLAVVSCALAQAPVQVADAPDVAAAKAHFFAIQKAETVRNLHGYHHGYAHLGYPYLGYPYLGHHGLIHKRSAVEDTPEVAAAKKAFFAIQKAETVRNLHGYHGYGYLGYPYLGYAHLGYAHPGHLIHKRSAQAPEPVEDTPEVAAAKKAFQHIFDATAARDKHLAAYPYHYGYAHLGYPYLGYPYLGHHGLIHKRSAQAPEDTPEVAAAKAAAVDAAAKITALQAEQAAVAEAAPDFDLDGKISTHSGHLSAIDGKLTTYGYGHYPYGHLGYAHHGYSPLALGYAGHHGLGHFGYAHHGLGHLVHKRSASHPRRYHHYGYPRYSHHRYHARSYHH